MLLYLKFLLHLSVLFHDEILFLFVSESFKFTCLSLLFSSQPGSLLAICCLLVQLLFHASVSILAYRIFGLLALFYLQILFLLSSFSLFNSLSNDLGALVPLLTNKSRFVLFHFREVLDFLLLCHYLVQSLNLFRIAAESTNARLHFFDLLDTFIKALCLALNVLFLPILRPLLTNLKLDFESVKRFDYLLVRRRLVLVLACHSLPLPHQEVFLTLSSLSRLGFNLLLAPLLLFQETLLVVSH